MPVYKFHLRRRGGEEPDELGMECRDLNHAYLEAIKAIPDLAREILIAGQDPLTCAYTVCDERGRRLLDIPFAEILSRDEWRIRRARQGRRTGMRSARARDELALASFRRMFSNLNVGCVLMTPELTVVEMNAFGARHSRVDPEAIRGSSILDVFVDLKSEPKQHFRRFIGLARAGATSEIIDLPYHVLDEAGQSADGWWNARAWSIFDDDDRLLGLVEWAEPYTRPTAGGVTQVRVAADPTA